MDCFSSGPQHGLPINYPYVDPVLSTANSPSTPRNPPPPVSAPVRPWRPYNNATPSVQPIAPHSLPFQSHCSVVSGGGSVLDQSMSKHSSDSIGQTIYTASKLGSDDRFRQSVIKQIRDNKSLKLPKVDAEKFIKWKDQLIDELRGLAWRPNGKFILKYYSTDPNDQAISRTSNDLTYVLVGCANMQDDQTYRQLISGDKSFFDQDWELNCFSMPSHYIVRWVFTLLGMEKTHGQQSYGTISRNSSTPSRFELMIARCN